MSIADDYETLSSDVPFSRLLRELGVCNTSKVEVRFSAEDAQNSLKLPNCADMFDRLVNAINDYVYSILKNSFSNTVSVLEIKFVKMSVTESNSTPHLDYAPNGNPIHYQVGKFLPFGMNVSSIWVLLPPD